MKMRAIKFRGLDDAGEWCYGFYYEHEGFSKIWVKEPNPFQPELFSVIVKRETVGQSTGLNDKNGKEIWESQLREYKGKLYKVVHDGWRIRLERNLVEFGENESIVINEDIAHESILKYEYYFENNTK